MSDQNQSPEITNQEEDYSSSPLYEADPKSLDEIFSSIDKKLMLGLPREITDFEIDSVVAYYRAKREIFMKDLAEGKTARIASSATKGLSKKEKISQAMKSLDF